MVQCQSQQPKRWQKEEVRRQVMAPAVNTWMGQRGVGHCASDSAATSCAYLPSSPRKPSDPYARTLPGAQHRQHQLHMPCSAVE